MDKQKNLRSAFMTSSGDPYCLLNALHYYETVWHDEVDELWIALNSTMEKKVVLDLISRFPKKVKFIYLNQRLGYGKPLNLLLECSPKGDVLLLEDDSIIFKKGIVTKYFNLLDTYDVLGSPRMSCSAEVAQKLKEEFNLNYEGWGDRGPNFWPCFLFTHKELLLKTDRNFDPTDWGDTFCWMSVQLRRLTSNILEIPQYHCSPDDFYNKEAKLGIFDGECGYMHLGSLSSGIESYLLDDNQVPLTDREKNIRANNPQPIPKDKEMQKRYMWWLSCYEKNKGFDFDKIYYKALERFKRISGVKNEEVVAWNKLYKEVIDDKQTED